MNIANRLVLMTALAIGCALVLGMFALSQVKKVGDDGEYLYLNTLPSYDSLYTSAIRLNEIRALAHEYIQATDPNRLQALEREMTSARNDMLGQLDHYGKDLLTDAEDEALWKTASQDAQAYLDIIDQTLRLSRGGQKQEADGYLAGHAQALASAGQSLNAGLKFNTRLADRYEANYKNAYGWAVNIIVAVLVLNVLMCAANGVSIYRHIVGSLSDMRDTLTHMDRDLDFTVRAKHRADDEVGEMVDAFNDLVERIRQSLAELSDRIGQVANASSSLSTVAAQVSVSSTQQSDSASDMAATLEQMTVSIAHVADQAAEANRLSERSGQLALTGGGVISKTVEDIHKIAATVRAASEDIARLSRNSEQISAVVAAYARWLNKPTCWRSTPPSKPPAPGSKDAVSP